GVTVLAATNAPWDIDPALRRAGRFSDQIFIPPPDKQSRTQIFKLHTKKLPLGEGINFEELSGLTDGYSSADIKQICDESAERPWKTYIKDGEKRPITQDDFKAVIGERTSSLGPWFLQAKKQVLGSGEKNNYPELAKLVAEKAVEVDDSAQIESELASLKQERDQVEYMLRDVKEKYKSGDIDEDTLRELSREYAKKLIEMDAKIVFKKGGKKNG
ncbi:MAG: ATP-binding protein, partial [Candidatus Altiarchaeota archaeon]|nr:ATP-binding protein [Candidatus Altiarchaeota archaeon]